MTGKQDIEKAVKNRLIGLLEKRKESLLSIFYTAGFPKLESTADIARSLEIAGADLLEIGIPFSDPVADGPVIQASNKVALDNGMTVHKLLEQVREIRKTVKLPILLMGYLNPLMQYGLEKFCKDASDAGIDGLIVPDLPLREYLDNFQIFFHANRLSNVFLVSPTTSESRIREIDGVTEGFIYAVSASSTTGAKGDFTPDQEEYFERLRAMKLANPFLVGFGISTSQNFATACRYGAGAIVGSAFISLLKESNDYGKDVGQVCEDDQGLSVMDRGDLPRGY